MLHEHRELISKLKTTNSHFKKIFQEHNILHDDIERAQENSINDIKLEEMKKKKLLLKDEIYAMILKEKNR